MTRSYSSFYLAKFVKIVDTLSLNEFLLHAYEALFADPITMATYHCHEGGIHHSTLFDCKACTRHAQRA